MAKNFGYSWISKAAKSAFLFFIYAASLTLLGAIGMAMLLLLVFFIWLEIRNGFAWYKLVCLVCIMAYCLGCVLLIDKLSKVYHGAREGIVNIAEKLEDKIEWKLRADRNQCSGE